MCKHLVLVPLDAADTGMKKTCKPAMLGRIWHASRRALNLEHSPPHQFACSQWQTSHRPSTAYLIYRWILFLSVVSVGIASFACQRLPRQYEGPIKQLNYFKWFIYFTNWGFMLIALQAGLALAVVLRYRNEKSFNIRPASLYLPPPPITSQNSGSGICNTNRDWNACEDEEIPMPRRQRTPLLCRAYWLSHTVATDLAFVITLIYWTLVHDPRIHEINALNLIVHGGNSAIMLCELAVTAHPVRAAHALFGASAGLAYGVFSAFYWALGGTDRLGFQAIYPALDWSKPGAAFGFVALCAVVMVCAHCVATCLACLRARLALRWRPATQLEKLALPTH